MKTLFAIFILVMAGCGGSYAIYGVPEIEWRAMTPEERQATIERFKQQRKIYTRTRTQAKKTRKADEEFARKCHDNFSNECEVKTRHKWQF